MQRYFSLKNGNVTARTMNGKPMILNNPISRPSFYDQSFCGRIFDNQALILGCYREIFEERIDSMNNLIFLILDSTTLKKEYNLIEIYEAEIIDIDGGKRVYKGSAHKSNNYCGEIKPIDFFTNKVVGDKGKDKRLYKPKKEREERFRGMLIRMLDDLKINRVHTRTLDLILQTKTPQELVGEKRSQKPYRQKRRS